MILYNCLSPDNCPGSLQIRSNNSVHVVLPPPRSLWYASPPLELWASALVIPGAEYPQAYENHPPPFLPAEHAEQGYSAHGIYPY